MKYQVCLIRREAIIFFVLATLVGSLAWRGSAQLPRLSSALTVGDFDEDGLPDLVIATPDGNGQGIIKLRSGGGSTKQPFGAAIYVAVAAMPVDLLAAGDFDADGHFDLV